MKTDAVWVRLIGAAIMCVVTAGTGWAQTSGTPSNSTTSPPSAGSDQNRDAGERGRRGPSGGRFGGRDRGSRGVDRGNGGSSGSSGTAAAKPTTSPSTAATPEVSETERIRTWAKEIIQKHDKNGDMMLQESEWEGLGQSTKADANADHVITLDELIAFASRKPAAPTATTTAGGSASATSGATPPSSDSKPAGSGAASDPGNKFAKTSSRSSSESKSAKDKQKSYRFKTAKERLPAGLPGWFAAKDANGDGQVSMSEYSRSWSESQAAEFKRYDRDNDGIITAEEAGKK